MSKILLIEELRERERLSLLLLQKVLEQRGHMVRRTGFNNLVAAYLEQQPDLILDSTSTSVAHYLGNFLWLPPETRIVEGIWEQILSFHSFRRFDFPDSIQERYFDGHISWGPAFKETITSLNPRMDSDRIGEVGSIKHAEGSMLAFLSREQLASLYPFDIDQFEKVVLCATSFSLAPLDVERLKSTLSYNPFVKYFHRQHTRLRVLFTETLHRLVKKYDNYLFLVRAHPTKFRQYYDYYQKEFGQRSNLVLYSSGPISAMIALSDLVITGSSTVLMDAYIQSTPALNLLTGDPLQRLGLMPLVSNQFGYPICESDLDNLDLDYYWGKVERTEQREQRIAEWIGDHSPQAYEKWADFFEQIVDWPPLPKPISWRTMCTFERWRHAGSCFVERFLHHRQNRPVVSANADEFDYDRLLRLLNRDTIPLNPRECASEL